MKVVITGTQGFIGGELRRQCEAAGMTVIGIDLLASKHPNDYQMDIRDPQILDVIPSDADVVVHLAGLSSDRSCINQAIRAVDINVTGSLNVFRATALKKVPQFVFASSEWIYGEVWDGGPLYEDAPVDTNRTASEYALSKITAERCLFIDQSRNPHVGVTILRFGIVYGPRPSGWSAVEQLFNAVRRGEDPEVFGSAKSARRFIHVSDIASGIRSTFGRRGYEIFNLSGDKLVSLGDVIAESGAIFGRTPKVVERDPSDVRLRNPDNSRARSELGWAPKMSLRDGLSTLIPPGS